MSNIRVLESLIAEHGGVITSKLVDEHNNYREYLRELIRLDKLDWVAYGVYITPDAWEDKMLIHQLRRKKNDLFARNRSFLA